MEQVEAASTFLGEVAAVPLENAMKVEILTMLYNFEASQPVVRLVFEGFSDPAGSYAPFQPFKKLDLSGLPGCEKGVQLSPEVIFKAARVPFELACKLNVSKENQFEVDELVAIIAHDDENIGKSDLYFAKVLKVIPEGDRIRYKCSPTYGQRLWVCTTTLSSAYIARIPHQFRTQAISKLATK